MGIFGGKGDAPAAEPTGLSIVSVGMTVRGDLDTTGTVKIEGTVDGNVRARQQVLVARGGVVRGDLDAREAVVGGAVHGAIRCQERVEIQAGASVHGDLTTKRILVAEGAIVNGLVRMGEAPSGVRAPASQPETGGGTPGAVPGRPSAPVARIAVSPRIGSPGH
jgi:cytoskeletal protein CcmA (bactofilin family)